MTANKKAPAIRFKGFEEEWEERELREVVDVIGTGKSSFVPNEKSDINQYPILGSTSIIGYENEFDYSGDFLLTARVGANAGNLYQYSGNVKISDNTVFIQGKHVAFIFHLLTKFGLKKLSFGTGQPLIKSSELAKLLLKFPCPREETQIGNYFKQLDDLIQLQEQKLEKVTNLKKAMLEKMFPKENADVPEIRFKGFTEKWDKKKLAEVADFNPKSELPSEFEYVDLESVVGTTMVNHRTEIKKTAPSRAQRLAKKGDLFYQTVRPYQKNNYLFELPFNDYVFSTGYAQLRPKIDGQCLLNIVQRDSFVKDVLNNCTGTSYPSINSTDLALIEVLVSNNNEEQQKIGKFFQNLDQLISLSQQKIEQLKHLKQALLQKMFI